MDTRLQTANENHDVANVVKTTTPVNAKAPQYIVFNAKVHMKYGTLSARRSLQRKSGWEKLMGSSPCLFD